MKKNGFTIMELLAIIVIIALVFLIAVPIIGNVITSSRRNAFLATTNGLLDSAKLYLAEAHGEGEHQDELYIDLSNIEMLDYTGAIPDDLYIDMKNGETGIFAVKDEWCSLKNFHERTVRIFDIDSEECLRGLDLNLRYTISKPTGNDNWFVVNPEVTVMISSTDSMGVEMAGYEYAISTDGGATFGSYSETINSLSFALNSEGKEVRVKLRAKNVENKYSKELVSPLLKIDKTPPTNPTISNPSNGTATNVPFALTLSTTELVSGIVAFEFSTNNLVFTTFTNSNTSPYTTGVYSELQDTTLYVRAIDKAGNVSGVSQTRINIVDLVYKCRSRGAVGIGSCGYNDSGTTCCGHAHPCPAGWYGTSAGVCCHDYNNWISYACCNNSSYPSNGGNGYCYGGWSGWSTSTCSPSHVCECQWMTP